MHGVICLDGATVYQKKLVVTLWSCIHDCTLNHVNLFGYLFLNIFRAEAIQIWSSMRPILLVMNRILVSSVTLFCIQTVDNLSLKCVCSSEMHEVFQSDEDGC